MASAAKRPRKFCTACKLEFSDRHFRRHMENCGNDKINLSSSNVCTSSDSNTDDNDAHQESPLFSDEEEVVYKNYDSKKKYIEHKTFCNISEEDAETFFDIDFENGSEILETSDSDSDEIDISMDTDLDVEESKKAVVSESESINVLTRVVCTFLVLWQSVYNVSDSAVEALLKLFSTVFNF